MNKKSKTILITGGGTRVPIDDIRFLGNVSTGRFAAELVQAALKQGHEVWYLHAKGAVQPNFIPKNAHLHCVPFTTFKSYRDNLRSVLKNHLIDIALLGAAVSDFSVRKIKGKISSKNPLTLKLIPQPKIISQVQKWSKRRLFQVGFKLLSGVSQKTLIEAAYRSGLNNHSHLTIANDLHDIKSGHRKVVLVTPEHGAIPLAEPNLADSIISFITRRAEATYNHTRVSRDRFFAKLHKNEIIHLKQQCKKLARAGLMPIFFSGNTARHGSVAVRTTSNSFLITSRSSNKLSLSKREMVLVKHVRNRTIYSTSLEGAKPSLNASLCYEIFRQFPKINCVIHTHKIIPKIPTTSFHDTPGTAEYVREPVALLKKNRIINLIQHGTIAVGSDLSETTQYVIQQSKTK